MAAIRAINAERRSAAVRVEAAQRDTDRNAFKGITTTLEKISQGKGKATPAEVRDAVADLAQALKNLPALI